MTEELLLYAGRALLAPDARWLREMAGTLPGGDELEAALPSDEEELRREHTRLFFAPEGAPCPPWQSVRGEEAALMGPSHHSALAWYREAGMEPAAENEPADHAGLLLAFYATLAEGGAPEAELAQFRREHLEWIPEFCDCLEANSRLPFYRELARRTRAALAA
jgi:TorA maturation chaperone TorD